MDANGAKSRIWVSHRFCIESGTLSGAPPPRKVRPGWWSKDLVTGTRGRRWQVIQLLGCQPKKIRIDCEKVRPLQQMNPAKKIPARKGPVTFKKLNSDSRPRLRREAPQRRPAHRGAPSNRGRIPVRARARVLRWFTSKPAELRAECQQQNLPGSQGCAASTRRSQSYDVDDHRTVPCT
jgi:hypothetical protein